MDFAKHRKNLKNLIAKTIPQMDFAKHRKNLKNLIAKTIPQMDFAKHRIALITQKISGVKWTVVAHIMAQDLTTKSLKKSEIAISNKM